MSILAVEQRIEQHIRHEHSPGGLWATLAQAAQTPAQPRGLWRRLAAPPPADAPAGVWQALGARADLSRYQPQAVPDVAEEQVSEGDQTYTVIRSPRGNYLRLTPQQRELWHMMDGTRSVAQLGVAAFLQFKQLLPVGDLVLTLKHEGFLADAPVGVYRALARAQEERSPEGWGRRLLRALTGASWRFRSIDGFYGAVYRCGARLLFTPLFAALWGAVALAGLAAFVLLLADRPQHVMAAEGLGWDLAALWCALLISFFLHESAHALTVKHYGRTLYSGGMILYFGTPAFFVDTTDIWRSPRRARILVSAAGPMSDLFVGGLAALLVLLGPPAWYSPVAYKLALTCYIATLFNINPLLELDGYFILVDRLRLPDLRRRALAFVRRDLAGKIAWAAPAAEDGRRRLVLHQLTREERIFTLYGLLTLAYTVVAVVFAVQFWNRQLVGTIGALWRSEGMVARAVAGALVLLVLVPLLAGLALAAVGLGRAALAWVIRRGYGRRPDLLAGAGALAALALAWLAWRGGAAWHIRLLPVLLWLVAAKAMLALRPDYGRAAIAPALDALALSAALASVGAALRAITDMAGLAAAFDGAALLFVLLAGFTALLDVNLRMARPRELMASALLLILAFVLGGVTILDLQARARSARPLLTLLGAAPVYFGTVALGMLLPLLFALRDSRLIWSWALIWVAVLIELLAYLADLTARVPGLDVLAAGLWGAAGLVHLATLRQIALAELKWPSRTSTSEAARLALAFQHCYAGCFQIMRAVYGARRTRELDDRMDVFAATANWDITLDRDEARIGETVRRLSLDQQGDRYAEVLRYTVATIEELAGVSFARRAIRAAYDALPWAERETASRLCFPDTPWARELSRSFGDAQQTRLRLLRQVELFLNCDDTELAALQRALREHEAPAGAALLRAGAEPPGVWIVEAGEVLARRPGGQIVQELHRAAVLGAQELLTGAPSALSYHTSLPASLLFIPAAEFLALVREQAPHAAEGVEIAERLRLLERVSLFADAPRQTLRALARLAQDRRFEPRSVVVRQSRPGGTLHIIRQGRAAVVVRGGPAERPRLVARLGPEEFFGELELLRGTPPVAHVLAETPLTTLALPHSAVRELLLGDSSLASGIEQIGSGRLIALRQITSA